MYQGNFQIVKSYFLDPPISQEQMYDKCCAICTDLATHPVCCTVCKSLFCLKCASMWKSEHNSCPKKCQSPWNFSLLDSLNLTLKCPYSETCPKSKPQTLISHLQSCTSAPEDVKLTLRRRANYLCENEHVLQFWIGTFDEMIKGVCAECGQSTACRSKCAKCKLLYCVNCRPPPCSKTSCPNGHNYIFGTTTSGFVCDLCGLRPALFDQGCYDDIRCNFGFCENCYSKLPEVASAKIKANNYQECKSAHKLTFLAESISGVCSNCEGETKLQRQCRECKLQYCMECKPIRLHQNLKCFNKHSVASVISDKNCTSCHKYSQSYEDRQCGFSLCEECCESIDSVAREVERISGQFCNNPGRHRLKFREASSSLNTCVQCHENRHCPLICSNCNEFYCIKCRPSFFKKQDYYGHEYVKEIKQQKDCFACGQPSPFSFYCDLCNIALCVLCYRKC